MELECGKNVDFWRDMTTITEDEISKLRKLEASGKGPGDEHIYTFNISVLNIKRFILEEMCPNIYNNWY